MSRAVRWIASAKLTLPLPLLGLVTCLSGILTIRHHRLWNGGFLTLLRDDSNPHFSGQTIVVEGLFQYLPPTSFGARFTQPGKIGHNKDNCCAACHFNPATVTCEREIYFSKLLIKSSVTLKNDLLHPVLYELAI